MRLIDADALWESVGETVGNGEVNMDILYEELRAAPAIDAKPVEHGSWIAASFPDAWVCSRCGTPYVLEGVKYCHNCGAKMDMEPATQ